MLQLEILDETSSDTPSHPTHDRRPDQGFPGFVVPVFVGPGFVGSPKKTPEVGIKTVLNGDILSSTD